MICERDGPLQIELESLLLVKDHPTWNIGVQEPKMLRNCDQALHLIYQGLCVAENKEL